MIMVSPAARDREGGGRLAVVVTVAKGYDLGYIWKTQAQVAAGRTTGGYYLNAAQTGEPPGRWWGPGGQALGLTPGQVVERQPYGAVYGQVDPRTGAQLGRPAAAIGHSPITWPG
jgi:hypothetical protein